MEHEVAHTNDMHALRQLMKNCRCVADFYHSSDKMPDKQFKETEGLFWLTVLRDAFHHGGEGMVAGSGGWLATLHP